jgi:hypothetical protein
MLLLILAGAGTGTPPPSDPGYGPTTFTVVAVAGEWAGAIPDEGEWSGAMRARPANRAGDWTGAAATPETES